mgnify:CR=1 FL=1
MKRRAWGVVVAVTVLATAVAIGIGVLRATDELVGGPSGDCTVTVGGHTVDISGEQAENAALIASIAVRRGLPARATSIALATAYQESKLQNIDYGDRDSLGLFQQRPSQGWGTREQILDPEYATNAFYDALVKVDGYQTMEITVAAQRVQRSAFPDAYADHEADGRALASALSGHSPATFSCDLAGGAPTADAELTGTGLTPRADAVRKELLRHFGRLTFGENPTGGRGVDVVAARGRAGTVRGWAIAHWTVANAARLEVRTVRFDTMVWTAGRDGWRRDDAADDRDHVRVDVFR